MKGTVTKTLECIAQFQSFYLCIYHRLFWIRQKNMKRTMVLRSNYVKVMGGHVRNYKPRVIFLCS